MGYVRHHDESKIRLVKIFRVWSKWLYPLNKYLGHACHLNLVFHKDMKNSKYLGHVCHLNHHFHDTDFKPLYWGHAIKKGGVTFRYTPYRFFTGKVFILVFNFSVWLATNGFAIWLVFNFAMPVFTPSPTEWTQ